MPIKALQQPKLVAKSTAPTASAATDRTIRRWHININNNMPQTCQQHLVNALINYDTNDDNDYNLSTLYSPMFK